MEKRNLFRLLRLFYKKKVLRVYNEDHSNLFLFLIDSKTRNGIILGVYIRLAHLEGGNFTGERERRVGFFTERETELAEEEVNLDGTASAFDFTSGSAEGEGCWR